MSHDKDKDKKRKAREKEKAREKDKNKGSHAVGSEEKPGERGGKFSVFTLLAAVAGALLVVAFVQPLLTVDHIGLINEIKLMSDNQYLIERNEERINAGDAEAENLKKENERLRNEIRERSDIIKGHIDSHLELNDMPEFESRIDIGSIDENVRYDDWFALVYNMSGVVSVKRDMLGTVPPEEKRELLHSVFETIDGPTGLKIFKTSNLFLRHDAVFETSDEVRQTVSAVRWLVVAVAVLGIVAIAFAFISRFGRMNAVFLMIMFLPALAFALASVVALIPLGAVPSIGGLIEPLPGHEPAASGDAHDHAHSHDAGNNNGSSGSGDLANAAGAFGNGSSAVTNAANMNEADAANAANGAAADAAKEAFTQADVTLPELHVGSGLWFMLGGAALLLVIVLIEPAAVLVTGASLRTFARAAICYGVYIAFAVGITSVAAVHVKDMLHSIGLKAPLLAGIVETISGGGDANANDAGNADGNADGANATTD